VLRIARSTFVGGGSHHGPARAVALALSTPYSITETTATERSGVAEYVISGIVLPRSGSGWLPQQHAQ